MPVHPHAHYDCWTCTTYRLKDTTHRNADGTYQI